MVGTWSMDSCIFLWLGRSMSNEFSMNLAPWDMLWLLTCFPNLKRTLYEKWRSISMPSAFPASNIQFIIVSRHTCLPAWRYLLKLKFIDKRDMILSGNSFWTFLWKQRCDVVPYKNNSQSNTHEKMMRYSCLCNWCYVAWLIEGNGAGDDGKVGDDSPTLTG